MAATSGGFHNEGCPESIILGNEKVEWEAGYSHGFGDNYIETWRYRFFSKSFLLGYRAGKAEIDKLVDEAAQSRYL